MLRKLAATSRRSIATTTTAMLAIGVLGCAPPAPEQPAEHTKSTATLHWTAIPDSNVELLKQKYAPVSRYLEDKLGVKVEYLPVADYKASVEAFRAGDVQLAWFGGLTGVQARASVDGARAIAQGEEDPKYVSYFIAHKSTGLERSDAFPTALAEIPFTFGSESSTSGRLMPEYFIRQESGQSPADFFKAGFSFSGAHDLTARLVADGTKLKAGVLSYKTYDRMVEEGELDPEIARIIWVTPTYADYNFTAHPRLDEMFRTGFIDELQVALTEMSDPELLAAFPRRSLIRASNSDFEGVVEVARSLELIR